MDVRTYAEAASLDVLVPGEAGRTIEGGYCGDLLSWVMGRAQAGDAWITVMGNVNAVAVAVLADVACIVLAENAPLDEDARERAASEGVPVLRSSRQAYPLALELGHLLEETAH